MYRNGMLLNNKNLSEAPSYNGCVTIEEIECEEISLQYRRKARLLEIALSLTSSDVIPPLYAPQLFELGKGQMMVCGYQISFDSDARAIQQHKQSWLILATSNE